MKTKYMPGPWFTSGPWMIQASGDYPLPHYIAEVKRPPGCDTATREANANLIAAAPDLLAALESLFEQCAMVHRHWGDGDNSKEADAAQAAGRAAIAKARGAP